jgi:hypothetical protein
MCRGRGVWQRCAGGRLMDAADWIDTYVDELERQLRVPRRTRRRILTEVRAHLLDAAEAEQPGTVEGSCAAERAVLRFGPAADTARQFNHRAGRRNALLRRALVPSIAAFAVTSMATATVWAFGPAPAPSRSRQAPDHLARRHGATQRAPSSSRRRGGTARRPAPFPTDSITEAGSGWREGNEHPMSHTAARHRPERERLDPPYLHSGRVRAHGR